VEVKLRLLVPWLEYLRDVLIVALDLLDELVVEVE
jgi:hypothetical protein